MKEIDLEEILNKCDKVFYSDSPITQGVAIEISGIKNAMLEFGKQLLELAVENVVLEQVEVPYEGVRAGGYYIVQKISKESITDTIKQIK